MENLIWFAPLLGVITGLIAQKKNQRFFPWWAFGTLLFIVALPMILLMDDSLEPGTTRCPYCGRHLKAGTKECAKCKRALPQLNTGTVSSWERVVERANEAPKGSQ